MISERNSHAEKGIKWFMNAIILGQKRSPEIVEVDNIKASRSVATSTLCLGNSRGGKGKRIALFNKWLLYIDGVKEKGGWLELDWNP